MMKIKEYHIKTEKTARYFSNEISGNKINNFWFVIHGYAQLAADFIKEFDFLSDENTLIVAPEGLSKFYSRNKVAASWMTKEDRNNEISDYLNYLDKLVSQLRKEFDLSSAKFHLLGFSQGVHTAVRFFINSEFRYDNLILCSSDFPADVDFEKFRDKLENSQLYFIYGTKDGIISKKTFLEIVNFLKTKKVEFNEIFFDGNHEIHKDTIIGILKK